MSINTTRKNQRYRVILALPDGSDFPDGESPESIHMAVRDKLDRANEYWNTVSYDAVSFVYDMDSAVVPLPNSLATYFLKDLPASIVADDTITFPVTFAGGETLEVRADDGSGASTFTVTLPAGDLTEFAVRQELRDAIAGEFPVDPPLTVGFSGLEIISTSKGSAAVADVVGGTARDLLGFGATADRTPGRDKVDEDFLLITEAASAWIAGRDAAMLLGPADGVIVVVLVSEDDYRASATQGATELEIDGTNFEFSFIDASWERSWQVFAHEIGHNLGFPDLYDEPGPPELLGEEVGVWDIMADHQESAHPCAWIKHELTGDGDAAKRWIPESQIVDLDPEQSREAILIPYGATWPAVNPFATDAPGVPICRTVRVNLGAQQAVWLENRGQWFGDDDTWGENEFSFVRFGSQIVAIDAHNEVESLIVFRSNAIKAAPEAGPFEFEGRHRIVDFPSGAGVVLEILDRFGFAPRAYHVRVTWEPAPFTDLRITPWSPPPYESTDMWVDTLVDNRWDEYDQSDPVLNPDIPGHPTLNGDRMAEGERARVYARFWNDGNVDAERVDITFSVAIPAAIGPSDEVDFATDQITVPAHGSAVAVGVFEPRTSNDGHVCIRVRAEGTPGDLNLLDNTAQENFTHWYLPRGSPYEPQLFTVQVTNPLHRRARVSLRARGLQPGMNLDVDWRDRWFEPFETIEASCRLSLDDGFPNESQLVDEVGLPVVSLEGTVWKGDAWHRFGGISGVVHPVNRTDVDFNIDRSDDAVFIGGTTNSSVGPVPGATVTVKCVRDDAVEVILRTRSDAEANFVFELPVDDVAECDAIRIDVSPKLGFAPWISDVIHLDRL